MTPEDIREYNKIVIEVSEKMCKPWKWTTFILAGLLTGMMTLYFLNPVEIDLDANGNNYSLIKQNR